ncbi:MAG: TIGR03905 family TSCPD domain-containing protein [Thermoguttaceae bacterium]|nr:TIGR03905 family TSCPD domain-containing protein [Thermoguttaceae bacterium]
MKCAYNATGVCARQILFDLTDGKVHDVQFVGGCPGNQVGVANLVEGMDADEVIKRLKGIRCGGKPTSCPDQLAKALIAAKEKAN